MPFIPHTPKQVQAMLTSIGVNSIEDLFDEIPNSLRANTVLSELPDGLTEMALTRLMQDRAREDQIDLNFIGAGAYEHHIPAAVWDVVSRGEWMTAYTPYQAEASQGTLQLLYEYQTMMARLMNMEVSNASLYDGASALAESILMAVRCQEDKTKSQTKSHILIPKTVHPFYRQVVSSIVGTQPIDIIEVPYCLDTGNIDIASLDSYKNHHITALVIPSPNFFGVLEEVDALVDWAHDHQALAIGLVNPMSAALLSPAGDWGKTGADIVCGEGQPLGIPLASGGPYFGFLCCKKEFIRQLPGRLVGRTVDKDGNIGFTLTLQAREQHIRRAKATSNICTNQGLLVTAATIFMSILGSSGLYRVAAQSHTNAQLLSEKLQTIPGIKILFPQSSFFHELVLQFTHPVEPIIQTLAKQGIAAGFNLKPYYPELGEALLVCTTETKTPDDLKLFVTALQVALA